jgi:hypothetical protein
MKEMKNQVFHIFRKDVLHHWPEILLSFAAIGTYAWRKSLELAAWPHPWNNDGPLLPLASVLVPVAWVLIVVRVTQGESLVGDRQFWVTRPYGWGNLLLAKVLFILVFVNIPLFLLQSFLLAAGGFSWTAHLSGLLWLQLLWWVFIILPVLTLATVTAGLGQFALTVLGGLVTIILATALLQKVHVPGASIAGTLPAGLGGLILLATSLGVVVWQFARRHAVESRAVIIGALALLPILVFIAPYRMIIAHRYPPAAPGQQLPVQIAFNPAPLTSREGGHPEKNKVHILIPLLVSGVEGGTVVDSAGMMETIQASGGVQWNSGWHGAGLRIRPGFKNSNLDIALDKDFFERVKSTLVDLRITLAMESSHARESARLVVEDDVFPSPGQGRCSYTTSGAGGMWCTFPLTTPFLLVRTKSDDITCPAGKHPLPAGMILYNSAGEGSDGPAEFGLNPISTSIFWNWEFDRNWNDVNNRDYAPHACPGTPLTVFSNWEDLPRYRTDVEINGIRLADYQLNDTRSSEAVYGVTEP